MQMRSLFEAVSVLLAEVGILITMLICIGSKGDNTLIIWVSSVNPYAMNVGRVLYKNHRKGNYTLSGETTLSLAWPPFWKKVYSKKKEFAPKGKNVYCKRKEFAPHGIGKFFCSQRGVLFSFTIDPLLERSWFARKQTGSQQSYFPCLNVGKCTSCIHSP